MKKVIFIFVCIASVFIINGFMHSIINLWQKQQLIVQVQHDLLDKKKENIALKKLLRTVKTDSFVEQEARDKLFFGKPGESVVIVPQTLLSPTPIPSTQPKTPVSHWDAWIRLIFNPSS